MSSREWPKTVARILALFGVITIVSLSGSSDWFIINGEGKYVEGLPREPTIIINYTVNSTEEQVDLEFRNYTPLMNYWRNREPVPVPMKNYSVEEIEAMEEEKDEEGKNSFDLQKSREIMSIIFGVMILIQVLSFLIPNMKLYLPFLIWFLGVIGFVVLVPLGVISSFGLEGPTGGFSDETEESDFAHMNIESDIKFDLNSIKFTVETLGFDLGLVPLEDHESVKSTAPKEGDEHFDSLIGFNGLLELEFSDGLKNWLYIPLIWFGMTIVNWKFTDKINEEE